MKWPRALRIPVLRAIVSPRFVGNSMYLMRSRYGASARSIAGVSGEPSLMTMIS